MLFTQPLICSISTIPPGRLFLLPARLSDKYTTCSMSGDEYKNTLLASETSAHEIGFGYSSGCIFHRFINWMFLLYLYFEGVNHAIF